jgi:hypothetical protein
MRKLLLISVVLTGGLCAACSGNSGPGPDTYASLNEEYRQATKLFYEAAKPAKQSQNPQEFAAILDRLTSGLRQHSARIEELRVQHNLAKDRSNWPADLVYADSQLKRGSENFLLWSSPVIKQYFPEPDVQRAARDFGMVMRYFDTDPREPKMDF